MSLSPPRTLSDAVFTHVARAVDPLLRTRRNASTCVKPYVDTKPKNGPTCRYRSSVIAALRRIYRRVPCYLRASTGRSEKEGLRLRDCETARLRDCETARLRDCETARLRDCETARLRDCETARLRDCETARLREKDEITIGINQSLSY